MCKAELFGAFWPLENMLHKAIIRFIWESMVLIQLYEYNASPFTKRQRCYHVLNATFRSAFWTIIHRLAIMNDEIICWPWPLINKVELMRRTHGVSQYQDGVLLACEITVYIQDHLILIMEILAIPEKMVFVLKCGTGPCLYQCLNNW